MKIVTGVLILLVILAVGWTIFNPNTVPGQEVPVLPNTLFTDGDPIPNYNSNPPTSGAHSQTPVPAGFYEEAKKDVDLVASLAQGYVVISYNCDVVERSLNKFSITNYQFSINFQLPNDQMALAQEVKGVGEEERVTSPNLNSGPSLSTGQNNSLSCLDLKSKIKGVVGRYQKVIALPRPNLDVRIALTAWGRMDKMGTWEEGRVVRFVEAFTGAFGK